MSASARDLPKGRAFTQAQIDEIRARVSLEQMVGRQVKLRRAGRAWKGLCPFHSENTPSFTVSDEMGFYHCFGCGAHGDCFRWVQETEGLNFVDAVKRLAEHEGVQTGVAIEPKRQARREINHDYVASATVGRWIWAHSVPARGEIVEQWLRARGLDVDGVPGGIDVLAFHPRCPVVPWRAWEDPDSCWLTRPAMVAPIADEGGAVWGVHCTYLSDDGRRKAALPKTKDGNARPARKMWGRYAGLAVRLKPAGSGPLVVGEGIETSWAYAQSLGRDCRVAAVLSLENLQGRELRLRDGSVPIWRPQADPARPGFTAPDAGEVIVLVDADMKPLRNQKLQLERGAAPMRADVDPLQRAELCAALAVQNWRRAGASRVTAVRPRIGKDFGDLALEGACGARPGGPDAMEAAA